MSLCCVRCHVTPQILSIHLLHEAAKGSASLWHPYLLQLPRQFTTFMTWPPAAVQALQVQYAQEAAAAAQHKARSEWAAARPALQELGKKTRIQNVSTKH